MSVENGSWTPGIGDPTIMGWVTVAVYFFVAVVCIVAAFNSKINNKSISFEQSKELRILWVVLSIALIILGINKQLDLQSLLTQIGKDLAIAQGWYEYRRVVQFLFIIFIGGTGAIVLTLLVRKYWQLLDHLIITLIGFFILFIFILIRAMSFHHMDTFIHTKLVGIKMNWLFELGGLVLILLGAIIFIRNINKMKKALD